MHEERDLGAARLGIILSPSHRRPNGYRYLPKVRAGLVWQLIAGPLYQARRWQCGTLRICHATVCVLREAWSPPLGGYCGTLAAAIPATSGYKRIGNGSADRKKVPAVQSFYRARR
jgi:hypothetical protein